MVAAFEEKSQIRWTADLTSLPPCCRVATGSETWLDWRLGYGSRVEQKIEVLERRVTELEERNR
uniref:Uncharacterized protein n=1 Tax=viral metagenome TaxID=1070528 RepID=A0A6M3K7L2_9ZZZZ